jgi:hypothetical protein
MEKGRRKDRYMYSCKNVRQRIMPALYSSELRRALRRNQWALGAVFT